MKLLLHIQYSDAPALENSIYANLDSVKNFAPNDLEDPWQTRILYQTTNKNLI